MGQLFHVKINAHLQWQVKRTRTGVVGTCVPLGLSLEASDEAELRTLIPESLFNFFIIHFEDRTLEGFLRRQGWTAHGALPPSDEASVSFDVPWDVVHAP